MLLCFGIALAFVISFMSWHFWQKITIAKATLIFCASTALLYFNLQYIYEKTTTDKYLVSGYITSRIYRPSYSYKCGKSRCHEPQRWIIEQRPNPPQKIVSIQRMIDNGKGIEYCDGECELKYPAPYEAHLTAFKFQDVPAYPILVDQEQFENSKKLGSTSVIWQSYYNPVFVSDEVIYNDAGNIPYFTVYNFNQAHRLRAPHVTKKQEKTLEILNSSLSKYNISIGIIITLDKLYYEKLKYAWHLGKANDFVIVIYSPNGKKIENINVLCWRNDELKEKIIGSISELSSVNIQKILESLQKSFANKNYPAFNPENFTFYDFLNIKIQNKYYNELLLRQIGFYLYMFLLFIFSPNSKNFNLELDKVFQTWDKNSSLPLTWYFHPLSCPGVIFYFIVPWFFLM